MRGSERPFHSGPVLCKINLSKIVKNHQKSPKMGVFEQFNVKILGTQIQPIIESEDRKLFGEKIPVARRMDGLEIVISHWRAHDLSGSPCIFAARLKM